VYQKRVFKLRPQATESTSTSRADLVYSPTMVSGTVISMRVALYGRVSKDNGIQDTENHRHELRDFCHRSKWTIEHEYVDRASGKTADTPQFKKLFEDAGKRRFDLVLFWSLDRFTREGVLETLNHLQRLSAYDVRWRSYQENYLDSCGPFRDVVISLMATLAKQERLRISERTKAGLQRARKAGAVPGRPRVEVGVKKLRAMQDTGMSLRKIAGKTRLSLSTVVRSLA
jgi:DNA invertase Pin-like site-specific DNA recombinase